MSMSPQEFAAKVEWEGGIYDAFDYGLSEKDLNRDDHPALYEAVKAYGEHHRAAAIAAGVLEDILESLTQ